MVLKCETFKISFSYGRELSSKVSHLCDSTFMGSLLSYNAGSVIKVYIILVKDFLTYFLPEIRPLFYRIKLFLELN